MTEQTPLNDETTWQAQEPPPSGWATGFIMFAGVMMIMAGSFQAFSGLVAIFENEFYVTTPNY
ncbi:MAG TPA: hypothetical protein VIP58_17520, partial [Nocardioides sp.]